MEETAELAGIICNFLGQRRKLLHFNGRSDTLVAVNPLQLYSEVRISQANDRKFLRSAEPGAGRINEWRLTEGCEKMMRNGEKKG